MSNQLKALREQLRVPYAEIRRLADLAQDRDFTSEEQGAWEKANADYTALEKRIGIIQQTEDIEASLAPRREAEEVAKHATTVGKGQVGGEAATADDWATALQGWCRFGTGRLRPAHEEAAARCGFSLQSKFFDISLTPHGPRSAGGWSVGSTGFVEPKYGAIMSEYSPAAGGVFVPTSFVNRYEQALLAYGGIRRVAEVMRTTTGETMSWPSGNDTSNTGRLISENPTLTTVDPAGFKATIWNAYGYTSDIIQVPFNLLEDSAVDLPAIIGSMLGERIGRITSTHFTTGDGAAKPNGIVTAATLGVTAASATAIAADELFSLIHSVDPAYRSMPGVGWAFHDNTFLALRKLKDGEGQYLWQQGLTMGEPNRLLGSPYTILQEMASSIATTAKTILFGKLDQYKIRDVGQYRLKRLDELYAANDLVGFLALSRHDGNLLDAGTHPVKYLQQA